MIVWKTDRWTDKDGAAAPLPMLDARTSGLIAGTKVATRAGWAPVETIQVGQQVLTFDGGLQSVVAVSRHMLMANFDDVASWPMEVPAGALGNREAMTILPHQPVMIESDRAEDLTGDPFALIPAASLDGLRGISQSRPTPWVEVIQLHFGQDEIVFANIGALFLCRARVDLASESSSSYDVLPLGLADDLVDLLVAETAYAARPAQTPAVCAA